MTCREMIEWLEQFEPDETVSAVIADPKKRLLYEITQLALITDSAAMLFTVGETQNLDTIETEVE